jgi:hypothetical protein
MTHLLLQPLQKLGLDAFAVGVARRRLTVAHASLPQEIAPHGDAQG